MVRRFRPRRRFRFRREQIQPAIDLEGVGAHDLRAETLRDFRRDLRFSSRGRTDDEKDAVHRLTKKAGRRVAYATSSPGFTKRAVVNLPNDARSISRSEEH